MNTPNERMCELSQHGPCGAVHRVPAHSTSSSCSQCQSQLLYFSRMCKCLGLGLEGGRCSAVCSCKWRPSRSTDAAMVVLITLHSRNPIRSRLTQNPQPMQAPLPLTAAHPATSQTEPSRPRRMCTALHKVYAELLPPAALLPSLLPLLLLSSAGAATLKLRSGISSPVFFRKRTLRPSSVTLTPTRLRTCEKKQRATTRAQGVFSAAVKPLRQHSAAAAEKGLEEGGAAAALAYISCCLCWCC